MRPRTLRSVAAKAVARGDWRDPLAEFLDAFYAMDGAERADALCDEPDLIAPMLEDVLPDAYLGAVGEHLARRWTLHLPEWTRGERRTLHRPLFEPDLAVLRAYLLRHSPVAFRRRLIFVGAEPLQRKGFCPGSTAQGWLKTARQAQVVN